jgi:hypothetical protein
MAGPWARWPSTTPKARKGNESTVNAAKEDKNVAMKTLKLKLTVSVFLKLI